MKDTRALSDVYDLIKKYGFTIDVEEPDRIYGASLMLVERDLDKFVELYFPGFELVTTADRHEMSPKYLLVDAHERLSWQYHNLRSEHWAVIRGPVGVVVSDTDEETPQRILSAGEKISIGQRVRHRLVGLETTGIIAEIWTHSDPNNPSSEADIIRLQDDYNRPRNP